jgi:hypothetical protein
MEGDETIPMIRIAVTAEAFDAVSATFPLGASATRRNITPRASG